MQFAQLSSVRHRVQLGAPLPFNVRHADQTLLLARGQQVESSAQLQALFERGALVDIAELQTPHEEILKAPRQQLPGLWTRALGEINRALTTRPDQGFVAALDDASRPVQSLIERDPDLAVFQVLRQGGSADLAYGAQRSLQSAITATLVAQRLGWTLEQAALAFKVGLTMNLSVLELQGQLARQTTVLSCEQREALRVHPALSVQMLELAGIHDSDWLRAVLEHHEQEDGRGYPTGTTEVSDLASLVRRADVYTAKLATRVSRDAMAADLAGRQMFMQDPGHPMTAALVKEFGIYPPGSFVRLASGELAMVIGRGEVITAPMVACLTDPQDRHLATPVRCSTSDRTRAVVAVVSETTIRGHLPRERLLELVVA
jgi:HD-GYP domain-containing protein (c-di-GMP phosphodiesterase class II)